MMKMTIPVTTRLNIVKSILSVFLFATITFTWPLWSANRYFPLFPGLSFFSSWHVLATYVIPFALLLSLILIFVLRSPRIFIFLSTLLCLVLLVMDAGRLQYWFYFYALLLIILLGYNWRVDSIHHYTSSFNAVKVLLALVYLGAAIQHFQPGFIHTQWPAFIKPFERFWTPEQCAYLLKIAYAVPFIELFMAGGLFFQGAKIAAISFSILFHLFSLVVVFIQPQTETAVVLWHLCMIFLVVFVFGGSTATQKNYGFAFGLYPVCSLFLFGAALPAYCYFNDKPMQNRIDLMQSNNTTQYIYLNEESKNKLPFYLQSFAMQKENEYFKLNVTSWSLHETKTRQVLGMNYLMRVTAQLNESYGAEALVAVPAPQSAADVIALK
jgi:hypothetical protein